MKEFSQLVEAAQAGDSEAYAALVQRFQGMATPLPIDVSGTLIWLRILFKMPSSRPFFIFLN
jgi:hypothetical protein